MATDIDEDSLPLAEFIKLPTTVAFNALNTNRFKIFTKNTPYIKIGTELGTEFVPVYTNIRNIPMLFEEFGSDFISFFPSIMSPLDIKSNDEAGISPIIDHPYLDLSGRGVIIGIVDTGIDYTKDVFKFEDNTSKILSIWDQTIDGDRLDYLYFGSVYTTEQINEANNSENPFDIVPTKDTDGHGTFTASVAAGSKTSDYVGAAPGAYIIAVKLKRAHQYFINKWLLPPDLPNLFESTDYWLGAKYIFNESERLNMPVVLCNTMGSNFSGHAGDTMSEDYISFVQKRYGYAIVNAAGNESNARHHTQGRLPTTGSTDIISIKVGDTQASFTMSIYGEAYDKLSVGITSPTGEVIGRVPFRLGLEFTEQLIFEKTTINIGYYKDVNTVIIIGFKDAKEGIWEVNIYGDTIINGVYHSWLPITGQVSPNVEFLKPVPEYTIVHPATSLNAIACGAYNSTNNSLYVSSSWGPTRFPRMSPDFVAPGVNVMGVYPTGFGTKTGTCVSAAITSGAAAILFEWGIVQGNLLSMDGDLIRLLLISGCKTDEGIIYPNTRWGYGKLDLFGTFYAIKESGTSYFIMGGTS